MIPALNQKLSQYVTAFNASDEECYPQAVSNEHAYAFLADQIPLLDCPDPIIEQTYYFRWWTFRKHWKQTPAGHVLTEFLPAVPWAGPYNTINCPVGHHLREGRWLKDPDGWMREVIHFWLAGHGNAYAYSMWLASAVEDYLTLHPDSVLMAECVDKLDRYFRQWEEKSLHSCGLYWSNDDRDGMEYSISGPGIRPTLNAYLYGDACAIARMAEKTCKLEIALHYQQKADWIHRRMDELLWDQDFYRVLPCEKEDVIHSRPVVQDEHRVRELIGYVPWYFRMPSAEKDNAFDQLLQEDGFSAPFGLTTAERRHPRFMFSHDHECLWNGYTWPFATSQTLTAVANTLHDHRNISVSKANYVHMLQKYARSHLLITPDGRSVPWIDEVMDPFTGEWSARRLLKADDWKPQRGGYERGKDYNHSTFCDLVLDGLFGIKMQNDQLTADPLIPEDWDYFCVTNLLQDNWTVLFDRTGNHYGCGKGLTIFKGSSIC